ncbi:MAG TPA: glycosyltransferase [Gaiellaceae bacterium]|nr:glycosyltransferase [Gaiellaceae bacterium]
MSAERPLVSVLMASYNSERWIEESIESVLAQTYPNVELIVADDASADATRKIVRRYRSERVRLLEFNERAGPTRRRNDALDESRGPLLAWADHDDVWLPEKLEKQVPVLEGRPEVGLVYTGFEAFDSETGATLPWRDERLEAEGQVLSELFVNGCFVPSITVVFRRSAMTRRDLRFREAHFSFGDDYFLWLVLSLDWEFARVNEVLVRYRRHGENESSRLASSNYHLNHVALLREFVREYPEARQRLGKTLGAGLAAHYRRAATFELARRRYATSARLAARAAAAGVFQR